MHVQLSIGCLSWLGMMIVHESGHVALAWLCGERVYGVELHPLSISRTDCSHDRHPLLVTWGGPLIGTLLPLGSLGIATALRWRACYLVRFFAGFCSVANGLYLGVGNIYYVGDAGDLLRFGSPRWVLVLFGLVSVPLGLWLWDGLGPHFGLGVSKGRVSPGAAPGALRLLLAIVFLEQAFDVVSRLVRWMW